MRNALRLVLALMAAAALAPALGGCGREGSYARDGFELQFSADTLSFDTLFTAQGSATSQLRVYNRSGRDVELTSVTLRAGRGSRFRLNVDGDTSMVARHVEIMDGDSIFIFVQVCIDPDDRTQPFLVEDAVVFGNGQSVPLTAWGRNAVYHRAESPYSVVDCEHWDHSRPHVILGTAAILDGHTLTLGPGDELYFGPDAMLAVDSNASLVARGTAGQPVLFSSLRSDGWYSFLPGQWQCIWFTSDSRGNVIDHAVLRNGTGGVRLYPRAEATVSNTVIAGMSDCALIGQGGELMADNLLVYDCFATFTALRGGSYSFNRCTMANYWNYSSRTVPSLLLYNHMPQAQEAQDLEAVFRDCIVWGSRHDGEVLFSDDGVHRFDCRFEGCVVKGMDDAEDPHFVDPQGDDYHLDEDSPATGKGYDFGD